MSESAEIYLDNSYTIRHTLTGDDLTSGNRVPATGLTVTAMITDSVLATTPIHADLQLALDEIGATGEYIGKIIGSDIAARLADHVGQVVYECISDGSSARFVTPLRVRSVRSS
jgi:hypothetical protein